VFEVDDEDEQKDVCIKGGKDKDVESKCQARSSSAD
jgi:hypothetical protein